MRLSNDGNAAAPRGSGAAGRAGLRMKVIWHHPAGAWLRGRLASLRHECGLAVDVVEPGDRAGLARALAAADVVWHVLDPCTAEHIAAGPRLRLIQKIGVGVNTIDLAAAEARGVAVCNMPGTNSRAVAEMTLALILGCLRRVMTLHARTRAGEGWDLPADLPEGLGEIGGRTVGLVGYGAVPRILAPVLRAMGARVLYVATAPKPDADGEWRSLDALLAESDAVSLHVPLTADTEGMIDAERLARMKRGAVLVNTARGGLVDPDALRGALEEGRLAAAGLDVFAEEPPPADMPLLALDNVLLTPHVAWQTRETLERSLAVAVENCRRLRAEEPLLHRVAR